MAAPDEALFAGVLESTPAHAEQAREGLSLTVQCCAFCARGAANPTLPQKLVGNRNA
jgi:hypothetical protein